MNLCKVYLYEDDEADRDGSKYCGCFFKMILIKVVILCDSKDHKVLPELLCPTHEQQLMRT